MNSFRIATIITRKSIRKPGNKTSSRFVDFSVGRMSDLLIEGILIKELRRIGYSSTIAEISDPKSLGSCSGKVALISINDSITLGWLIQHRTIIEKNFDVLIIGGQVVSLFPEIVRRYFSKANLFIGECEGNIRKILEDAEAGVRGIEYRVGPVDLETNYMIPARDYGEKPLFYSFELGRGCKYGCKFCAIAPNSKKSRIRNPEHVIEEMDRLGGRLVFMDPNLSAYDPDFLFRIFSHMERNKILWLGEGSTRELIENPEIWDLMSKTCIAFLTGVEDFRLTQLRGIKNGNGSLKPKNGVVLLNSMIIGHPEQREEDVKYNLEVFRRENLTGAFHLYAPYPGTRAYAEANESGSIIERNFLKYDRRNPIVRNEHMDSRRVTELFIRINKQAHTFFGTMKEIWRIIKESISLSLIVNRLMYLGIIRWGAHKIGKRKIQDDKLRTYEDAIILD